MRIAFWHSNHGGSPLVGGLERGLIESHSKVEQYRSGEKYDVVCMFNQCSHVTDYVYPSFPEDDQRIAFVDSAEYGYFRRLPEVANNYWNTFAEGSLSHDTKNRSEQERLMRFLEGKSFPYFIREYLSSIEFPNAYHPIDYPLYHLSSSAPVPNRDDYISRPLDLFCGWGGSHPWRLNITQALRECHTKCEIFIIGDNGQPRIPQDQFFSRTSAAKCSVSFDGYGSGSFRMTEVLCRCLLLQGPLSMRCREPLVDGITCIKFGVVNIGEEFVSTDVCEKLRLALGDPEKSFQIYQNGYHHCMAHYTEKATAKYLLKVIRQHDWGAPTQLHK